MGTVLPPDDFTVGVTVGRDFAEVGAGRVAAGSGEGGTYTRACFLWQAVERKIKTATSIANGTRWAAALGARAQ